LILVKIFKKTDIRASGSGNIGATNAVRVGGKVIGFFTLFFDALKGVFAIIITQKILAHELNTEFYQVALSLSALTAVLGHIFPIWLGFKGGKGVATSIAIILYLTPLLGFAGIACWIIVFLITRISSISALISMVFLTVIAFFTYAYYISVLVALLATLIFMTHLPNIKRIIHGKESKL
jgi:glycerol-3-phosphate acyltransferase PlsY